MGEREQQGADERANGRRPHQRDRPLWKRVVYPVIGLGCMILALIGAFLPVLQGWVFFVIGLPLLLAFHPPWEERMRASRHRFWLWLRSLFGKSARRDASSSKLDQAAQADEAGSEREGPSA